MVDVLVLNAGVVVVADGGGVVLVVVDARRHLYLEASAVTRTLRYRDSPSGQQ